MFDNLHFEIDEDGNPFFIATVYKKTIGLFGGKTADGCIVLNPTYIMVLKDSGGLVKLYAAVNVEQYNIVTTAATQKKCILKYKELLGIVDVDTNTEKETAVTTIKTSDIKYIDIDGNTYIYLISEDKKMFKAKASSHEDMLLLSVGDTVEITHTNEKIVSIKNKK